MKSKERFHEVGRAVEKGKPVPGWEYPAQAEGKTREGTVPGNQAPASQKKQRMSYRRDVIIFSHIRGDVGPGSARKPKGQQYHPTPSKPSVKIGACTRIS